ncbi:MAG: tRNA epoxyqueuosine(34) reductase QueG [Ignavibacteriales bacterium]|nr:tRNA epoxyqueuosine(34) reductase QueG [Ignavibacteriales bacterium]
MILTNKIIADTAKKIGFNLVGFAKAEDLIKESTHLEQWLNRNYNAEMEYMQRNFEKRNEIRLILEDAKSVISLGVNYYCDEEYSNNSGSGKVSRYAWGKDYHLVIWEMLDKFVEKLQQMDLYFSAKTYIDTGPVMDKAWAVKAGLGWQGKHTNVINKDFGSWFFIATVITNYEFDYLIPVPDYCGTCKRCIDACPTNAIIDDYVLDSNKCISYLTIENKKEIPNEFAGKLDNWLFGCDICQDVCPWNNKFAQPTQEPVFYPKPGHKEIPVDEIILMEKEDFDERFFDSPIRRTKLKGLKRNALFLK